MDEALRRIFRELCKDIHLQLHGGKPTNYVESFATEAQDDYVDVEYHGRMFRLLVEDHGPVE